ncbi:small ribosomal subunit Rsm22 family protein [Fodinicola feengrottensis]|uniref:small ribosomal subunit Rsm22 family protein n=1 Tax=Fodinicola feengrottensis TaxID=435914 RepID=UPI0036F3D6BC
MNELSPSTVDTVLSRLALSANTVLIVEPGTPRGFAVVRQARERLVSLGMSVAAPLPTRRHLPDCGPRLVPFFGTAAPIRPPPQSEEGRPRL